MTHLSRYFVIVLTVFIMAVPVQGQDFNKHIHNRMTSAGSGQGIGETMDMHVLIGQPIPGMVGNGQLYQVRTNAEDMLSRRLNYTLVANAGLDQSTVEGHNVMLDASLSYDPANAIEKYQWIQLSGPSVELNDSNAMQPQFIAPEVSTFGAYLVFQLTVFNTNNVSAQDTVKIFVQNEIKHFIITVSASAGGNISPNENTHVREGDSIRFSFLASTGYYLSDVIVDGISVGPKETYDFVEILDNHQIYAVFTPRPKIQVAVSVKGLGSVEPEGPINVNAGDDVQLSFSPHANYHVSDVIVDGRSRGPMNDLLLKNLNDNVLVTVNFMLGDFHIQSSCDENGSITPTGWISTYFNENKSFQIVPDPGYTIDKIQVNGSYIDPISHYTFWNITDHHRIHATFRPKMVIMAASGNNGTILPSGTIKVEAGSYKAFEMLPDDGYRIADVLVDGESMGPIEKYIFWDIQTGHTIDVQFVRNVFTIEATSGPYGSVSPEGKIAVSPGDFQFFEFNPDHGFRVASVQIDGDPIAPVDQYYFENIDTNHSLNVQFEPARIIVQAVAGSHGKIYPSGAVVVAEGASQEFQIQPDTGYTIQNVRVDEQNLGKVDSYVFENLKTSHTIEVVFEAMPIITATAMANGSISPTGQIYVPKGDDLSIMITADDGYMIDTLIVDSIPVPAKNIFVFWNVTQNHNLLATFRQFQLTATADENGSITPQGLMQVSKGHDQTFEIQPNEGYAIADVIVDKESLGPISRYTLWDIKADHDIHASFVMRPRHTVAASAGEGGRIIPSGETTFLAGDYPEFHIIPNSGYKILDVQVNDASQGPISNYIFSDLQENASIHALFYALPKYTFTVSANEGGQITPQGILTVVAGEFISFDITPAPNHHIESVFVDNIDFGPIRSYPMLADDNHHITAIFASHETRSISGQIFDQDQPDLPLPDFHIQVFKNDTLQGSATSDSNGQYSVTGLPVASDLIVAVFPPPENIFYQGIYYNNKHSMLDANHVIVLSDNLQGFDLYVPKAPTEGFTGQVHDRNTGIASVEVYATSRDGSHSASAVTDADGHYELTGLYSDLLYRISAYDMINDKEYFFTLADNQTPGIDSPSSSAASANLAKWLTPTKPVLAHIDIILDPDSGAQIAGHVYLDGVPINGITVNAWSPNLRIGGTGITDDSGAYVLQGLFPVDSMAASNDGYLVEIVSDDYVYQAFPSLVATGQTDIDFHLENQSMISGHVSDQQGEPLSGVLIQAVSTKDAWHKSAAASSDSKGNYTLILTPAPDYVIHASKTDYGVQYYPHADTPENATVIDARSLTQSNIDFQLNSGASIQGNIYIGTTNTPASEGVWITIRSESDNFVDHCQTNAQGHYVMRGLDDNVSDYIIMVRHDDDMPVYYNDNGDTDVYNDSVYNRKYAGHVQPSDKNCNLILLPGYRIRGRILFDNTPVTGVTVEASSETTGGWGRMLSEDLGAWQYEISALPPGIYTVKVSGKDYQTSTKSITLMRQTSYLDFVLQLPQRQINGVIYGVNKSDILWVKAISLSQETESIQKLVGTDAALPFTLDQLQPADDYIVYAYGQGYPEIYYPDQRTLDDAHSIDLHNGNADNIVFHMPEKNNRHISGIIQFLDAPVNGEIIRISARSETNHHEKTITLVYTKGVPIQKYTIDGLVGASDYVVQISSEHCVDYYYPNAFSSADAQRVDTRIGNVEDVNFEMVSGGSIQGQITGVSGLDIQILANAHNLDVQAETTPLTDGHFSLHGLAETDYILSAHIQDLGVFYYHPYKTVRDIADSTPISIANNTISDLIFTISELQKISGIVKSEKGNALANVFVNCHSASLNFGASTYSNDNGEYEIPGLLVSTDYVVTAVPDNAADAYHVSLSLSNIAAGDTQVNFVLQAQDAFSIDGQIVDPLNQPLKRVMVEIQGMDDPNQYDRIRTDNEGMFTLQGLPQGSNYMLWVWPESNMPFAYYRVTQISIPTPKFFLIELNAATQFGGAIVDDFTNAPIADAEITVFSDQTGFFQTTRSTSEGLYTITNAPLTADYRIVVQHGSYLDQERQNISPHNQLNIAMSASGCIYGHLSSSQTGSPVADANVSVFAKSFDSAPDFIGTSRSKRNGRFEVCNLKIRDYNGNLVTDYQVDVVADGYPIQTKGGLSATTKVDFLLESHPQYELSGKIDDTLGLDIVLKIFDDTSTYIQSVGIENNTFQVSGLNPEKGYRINVTGWQTDEEPVVNSWVAASGRLEDNESDGKIFATGDDIIIILSGTLPGKKRSVQTLSQGPGPVRHLRCLTHPYVNLSERLRNRSSSIPAEVTNRPNVAMTWDPPETDDIKGYYYSFDDKPGYKLTAKNTVKKPPIRTRKITSRDLKGDDMSYYFHVAPVDKAGRIGQTSSIAFRIDTQKPTNVNVALPKDTPSRDVLLALGANGASEMYISNVSNTSGGQWEKLTPKKQWQLSGDSGSKQVYVNFRDRAKNVAQTTGHTTLNVGANEHAITIKANAYGTVSPTQLVVSDKATPEIVITPNDGYEVSRMILDDRAVQYAGKGYIFSPVTQDHLLSVTFAPIEHMVYMASSDNGIMIPAGPVSVEHDHSLDIEFEPDTGFALSHITVDGSPHEITGQTFTLTHIQHDIHLTAHFKPAFTISATAGSNGTVEPKTAGVFGGKSQTFTFKPSPGYGVSLLWIDGDQVPIQGNRYTFYNVDDNHTLNVQFQTAQYEIVALSGANGTISPSGTLSVGGMSQKTFEMEPDDGYMIDQILIDNTPVSVSDNTYTFEDIADNHKIFATFRRLNYPPQVNSGTKTLNEDQRFEGRLSATDPNKQDVLTFLINKQPIHGSINLNAQTGDYVYQPGNNYYGSDSFKYQANDGLVSSTPATIDFNILPVNDAPEAHSETLSAKEDVAAFYTLTAHDIDNDELTFLLVSQPEKGQLTLTDPQNGYCVYRPYKDFVGRDAFTFKVTDAHLESNEATIEIMINNENDPPIIATQSLVIDEDSPYTMILSVTDPENDPLFFKMLAAGNNGNATIIDPIKGKVIYTPKPDISGDDFFVYSVTDNQSEAQSATVNVTIKAVNDPPVALQQKVDVFANADIAITLTAMDIDSPVEAFIFEIVETPEYGFLSGLAPYISYAPNNNFTGTDQLVFSVNDSEGEKDTGIIEFTVMKPPDAIGTEDHDLPLDLPVYVKIKQMPEHGKLMGTLPDLVYQPDPDYFGKDTFTYTINDQEKTYIVYISPVNDAPTITILNPLPPLQTNESLPLTIDIESTDVDFDDLTVRWEQPAHGSVTGNMRQIVYKPYPSYSGKDAFWIEAFDGYVTTRISLEILVGKVNKAPIASDRSMESLEDQSIEIQLQAMDPDNDSISYTIASYPAHGKLSGRPPTVIYEPDPNYHGEDSFEFTANDGRLISNIAKVLLTISPQNDPPIAINTHVDGVEDQRLVSTFLASDIDMEPITFQLIQNGQKGDACLTNASTGAFAYTPYTNVFGVDFIRFQAMDAVSQSNEGLVSITIAPVNDPPTAMTAQLETEEDIAVAGQLIARDIDNNQLVFQLIDPPQLGTINLLDTGSFTYTPLTHQFGQEYMTFIVSDASGGKSPKTTLTIDIHAINDPPVALPLSIQLNEDTTFSGTLPGSDVDTPVLSYTIVTLPQKGVVEWIDRELGRFVYQPNGNVFGDDNFSYQISDGNQRSETALVSVWITPVNDSPVLGSQNIEVEQNNQAHVTLMAEDNDNDPLIYEIITDPINGTASIAGAGLTYTPNNSFLGVETITVQAKDNQSSSKIATIQIWVGINQVDVIASEDEAIAISLSNQVYIVKYPQKGELTQEGDHFIFSPYLNTNGYDRFDYREAPDAKSLSVTIFIKPVNDLPTIVAENALITTEDQPKVLHIDISDPETDYEQLITSVKNAPMHGSIQWEGKFIEYRPFPDYNGSDSFTIHVSDGFENSFAVKTIDVTIQPENDAPRPIGKKLSVDEDKSTEFSLSATDIENDSITYAIYQNPIHGSLTGIPPNLKYTPHLDYFGIDHFQFIASDYDSDSHPQSVTIVVTGTQDKPHANDTQLKVPVGVQVTGQFSGSDPDDDILVYRIVTQGSKGSASVIDPTKGLFVYTPYSNETGEDLLTFNVSDSYETSNLGFVSIQIADSDIAYYTLSLTLTGDYLPGDTYDYSIVNTQTNVIVKQDQNDTHFINAQLPENYYEFNFSGDKYQALQIPVDLMADIAIPVTVHNNEEVFRLSIKLIGGYISDESVTVRIFDANTNAMVKSIDTENSLVETRLIANVYALTVEGEQYENYHYSPIYLDKDQTQSASLVRQSASQFTLNIQGEYQWGDPYEYQIKNIKTGNIVRQGESDTRSIEIPLSDGDYRILIIADNYDPIECEYDGSKIIHFTPDMQIDAYLKRSTFKVKVPEVEASYQNVTEGLNFSFTPENFTNGLTAKLNNKIFANNTQGTVKYQWTAADTDIIPTIDNGDKTYTLEFDFYDANKPAGSYRVTYTDYATEANELEGRPTYQKSLETKYGPAATIANGHKSFYPILGTRLNIKIRNIQGSEQTLQVDIPPIPLDYLFIDNSTESTAGLLMYQNDYYLSDGEDDDIHPLPEQKINVIVHHYCFGQSAGSGAMISFEMAEGRYAGARVLYNPILRNGRFSEHSVEPPPIIKMPLILNPKSDAYDSLSNALKAHGSTSFQLSERGDGIDGFKKTMLGYRRENDVIYLEMTHLTVVGFDVNKEDEPVVTPEPKPEPVNANGDSGGCWIQILFGELAK